MDSYLDNIPPYGAYREQSYSPVIDEEKMGWPGMDDFKPMPLSDVKNQFTNYEYGQYKQDKFPGMDQPGFYTPMSIDEFKGQSELPPALAKGSAGDMGEYAGTGQGSSSVGSNSSGMGFDSAMGAPEYGGGAPNAAQTGGQVADTAGNAAMASGVPPLQVAGLALKGAGILSGLYGAYKQREEAKKRYDTQMEQYNRREAERLEDKRTEEQRRSRQEGYYASDFAQGLTNDLEGAYGGYKQGGQ